jgi:hypothetical protein
MSQDYVTKGVPKLMRAEDYSVCLTSGFRRCGLAVIRNGTTQLLAISKKVAAELIAAGFAFQG